MDQQIKTCLEKLRQKTQEGYNIIKNNDRPKKLKTIHQQIQKIDIRFQHLLDKSGFEFALQRTTKMLQQTKRRLVTA